MANKKSRGNGTGSVYREGKKWTATITLGYYLDKDGKMKRKVKRKKGFRTKTDAVNYLPVLRAEIDKPQKRTIEELWQYWSANGMLKLSEKTQKRMRTAYSKIAELRFTDINDLTVSRMQEVLSNHAETYTPAKDIRTLFHHLFSCAMADKIATSDLSVHLVLPENNETRPDPFTADEVERLWADWDDGNIFTGFALVMIYTGMMPGEVMRLTKKHIDLDARVIYGAGLKTDKRRSAPVVLSDTIVPVFRQLIDAADGEKLWSKSESKFRSCFDEMLKRTGCRPTLKPYSCRHTTATALAELDTEINTIKEVMRHSNIETTAKYVHIAPQSVSEAVNSIAPLLHPDTPKTLM